MQAYETKRRRHCNRQKKPQKLTEQDKRSILRQVEILRRDYGYFTTKRLEVFAGVSADVSDETVRRVLRANGFKYTHSGKKEVLSRRDLEVRLKFAKQVRKRLNPSVWTTGVSFYLDGVGFTHKYNPHTTNHWHQECWLGENPQMVLATSKGSHEGSRGRTAHFIVAIAYNKGVILAEQYESNLNGKNFADFVHEQFPTVFENSCNKKVSSFCRMAIQVKIAKKQKKQLLQLAHKNLLSRARSPDLNAIENVFHNVKRQLQDDALSKRITKETYSQFCAPTKATLLNYHVVRPLKHNWCL